MFGLYPMKIISSDLRNLTVAHYNLDSDQEDSSYVWYYSDTIAHFE